jgi:HlyD family secretion protein
MKGLLFLLVLALGAGLGLWYWNNPPSQPVMFRTATVTRGDLLAAVNATGTIEPEEVVDVGAKVAGEIKSFGKDPSDPGRPINHGSPVDEGTVLALLEDSLFKARVNQARANLERAEAEVLQARAKLGQAQREFERTQRAWRLSPNGAVSERDMDTALMNHETAKAGLAVSLSSVDQAKANLEEATVNLGYTQIRSPVKGVVVDRRVNIGQAVVASLNVPSLFLIAKDLKRMEIWASVNETDLGKVHPGQPVRFTVSAFPGEAFRGRVSQVRLNASMNQNVVTYTVVIAVDNADGKLLPYLTARVQFEVKEHKNVLLVPNAALRWQPQIPQVAPDAREAFARSLRPQGLVPGTDPVRYQAEKGYDGGTLWVEEGGFVRPVAVGTGLTDGVLTEIVSNDLQEGSEVVLGQAQLNGGDDTSSPFLPHVKKEKAK